MCLCHINELILLWERGLYNVEVVLVLVSFFLGKESQNSGKRSRIVSRKSPRVSSWAGRTPSTPSHSWKPVPAQNSCPRSKLAWPSSDSCSPPGPSRLSPEELVIVVLSALVMKFCRLWVDCLKTIFPITLLFLVCYLRDPYSPYTWHSWSTHN